MTERWRKPVRIVAVEPDPVGVMTIGDRRYQNANITLQSSDDFERLVHGYVCAQCAEPHEVPFPESCTVCGFRMRDDQLPRLGLAFQGEKWIGPTMTDSDELARMDEMSERRARESGIVLPPGVR